MDYYQPKSIGQAREDFCAIEAELKAEISDLYKLANLQLHWRSVSELAYSSFAFVVLSGFYFQICHSKQNILLPLVQQQQQLQLSKYLQNLFDSYAYIYCLLI